VRAARAIPRRRLIAKLLTGEAKFSYLHDMGALDIQDGPKRASKLIDASLNLIGGRLGLDHDQVFFGRFGAPPMVRYCGSGCASVSRRRERDDDDDGDRLHEPLGLVGVAACLAYSTR
jgi:hypothetical protein